MVTQHAIRFPAIGVCHRYLRICLKTEVVDILGDEHSRTLYYCCQKCERQRAVLSLAGTRARLFVSQQQSLALHAKAMAHFIILLSRNIF